ncbi:hypothetical protein LTR56_013204 [Elasticomyces elasticus]|nr:hypothetical protein LTR56_013204 [Elasticomyces elasticus]KAK3650061.1 hypothetical protein LTR22_012656 [Elasticomyces elasticus]KAK5757172.1 hypothetical protein LTS12_012688 [Elasticomyces elasticus]
MAPPPDRRVVKSTKTPESAGPNPQEQHDSVVHEPSPSPTPPSSHDESQANEILEYLPTLQRRLDRLPEDYDRIVKLAEYSMRYVYLYLTYVYQHPEWVEQVQELRQSVGEELGQTGAERRAESIEDHGGEAVVAKRQQELFGQWRGFGGEDGDSRVGPRDEVNPGTQVQMIAKSSDQVMLDEPEVWHDAETGDDPVASEAEEEQATANLDTRCYANTPDKI